ncbi:hypothetical protein [Sphingomonas sp. UYEF23]|uniref:hypothetical protein n=1 Tax=Sphingomonas sp. UYEF23 TaxID=1756408 RepID=UPI0033988A1B
MTATNAGGATATPSKRPLCPATTAFTTALDHLDGYRVFVGPDGDSAVEPFRIDAKQVPMLKTGKVLKLLMLPKPGEHVPEIVVGPADVELPFHAAPYKEMFVLLGGSFTFKTAKESHAMTPGSVLLFDDVGAKVGHGGHIGPCGYVSLSVAPAQ